MKKFLETHDEGNNFFWAADMQKNLHEVLYVDAVHYTAHMNQLLAKTIVDFLLLQDCKPESIGVNKQ